MYAVLFKQTRQVRCQTPTEKLLARLWLQSIICIKFSVTKRELPLDYKNIRNTVATENEADKLIGTHQTVIIIKQMGLPTGFESPWCGAGRDSVACDTWPLVWQPKPSASRFLSEVSRAR